MLADNLDKESSIIGIFKFIVGQIPPVPQELESHPLIPGTVHLVLRPDLVRSIISHLNQMESVINDIGSWQMRVYVC